MSKVKAKRTNEQLLHASKGIPSGSPSNRRYAACFPLCFPFCFKSHCGGDLTARVKNAVNLTAKQESD